MIRAVFRELALRVLSEHCLKLNILSDPDGPPKAMDGYVIIHQYNGVLCNHDKDVEEKY